MALAARSDGICETVEEIPTERAHPVECDVTDEGSVVEATSATVEAFGVLDCLVNNAGIAGPTAAVEDVDHEDWERTVDVNVTGTYLTIEHPVPRLRASDCASIVNIPSISGKRPLPERTPYTASKMAVIGLTRTFADERGDDITAHAICPGATSGERMDRTLRNAAEEQGITIEEDREYFTEDAALGTFVDPEDTANMVAFLASEKGRHVTAQDINVDACTTWY